MWGRKDGGTESTVRAYGLEVKSLFSVLVLTFDHGSRDAMHSHAFNAISWLLRGELEEHRSYGQVVGVTTFTPALWPIVTTRDNMHKVISVGRSVALTFRGPWVSYWWEKRKGQRDVCLTHGRQEVPWV
jgi:hypothetical protein